MLWSCLKLVIVLIRVPIRPRAAPVVTGSHCDAIPLSGMYDGTLGVIGAIAAVKALNGTGFVPARPIDVMMFTSEEPTRFGLGCIGR
jgi:Iap family predicted aminopeptidase